MKVPDKPKCSHCSATKEEHAFRNGRWYCVYPDGIPSLRGFEYHEPARRMDDHPEKLRKDALSLQDRRRAFPKDKAEPLHAETEWGVKIEGRAEGFLGGIRVVFSVGSSGFTIMDDEVDDSETRDRAAFFQRMFFTSLAKLGVDTSTAINTVSRGGRCCSCGYEGPEETECGVRSDETHCVHWWDGPEDDEPLVAHRTP